MALAFTVDLATLISLMLEGILYGMFLTLFAFTFKTFMPFRAVPATMVMLPAGTILMLASTMHICIMTYRLAEAVLGNREPPLAATLWLIFPAHFSYIFRTACYSTTSLTWDLVLIYRLYAVTRSYFIVAAASILWVGTLAVNIGIIVNCERGTSLVDPALAPWVISHQTMSAATNFFCTGYLAFYLWRADRNVSSLRTSNSSLMPVIRIIVESGALYTANTLIVLFTFVSNNTTVFVFIDQLVPLAGVSFCLILLRLAARRNKKNDVVSTLNMSGSIPYGYNGGQTATAQSQRNFRPLQVELNTYTVSDSEAKRELDHA